MARVECGDAMDSVRIGVHEVCAIASMDVYVDEAGHHEAVDVLFGAPPFPLLDIADRFPLGRDQDVVLDPAADECASVKPHMLIFPSTVGRPPVAPGMFVLRPAISSLAMMASAIASLALLSIPRSSCDISGMSASRSRTILISVGLSVPPPPTITCSTGPRGRMKRNSALAMLSAVSAVAVAMRSPIGTPFPSVRMRLA